MTSVPEAPSWQIRILFDAECPLCAREGKLLSRLDAGRGRLEFEDISAPEFDATKYGLDQRTVEARIHAILPDGRVVEGVEVFSRAYAAVGWNGVAALTEWRGLRWLLDRLYVVFARNRLRITGRTPKTCTSETCEAPRVTTSRA